MLRVALGVSEGKELGLALGAEDGIVLARHWATCWACRTAKCVSEGKELGLTHRRRWLWQWRILKDKIHSKRKPTTKNKEKNRYVLHVSTMRSAVL